jgi:hypothetical protein
VTVSSKDTTQWTCLLLDPSCFHLKGGFKSCFFRSRGFWRTYATVSSSCVRNKDDDPHIQLLASSKRFVYWSALRGIHIVPVVHLQHHLLQCPVFSYSATITMVTRTRMPSAPSTLTTHRIMTVSSLKNGAGASSSSAAASNRISFDSNASHSRSTHEAISGSQSTQSSSSRRSFKGRKAFRKTLMLRNQTNNEAKRAHCCERLLRRPTSQWSLQKSAKLAPLPPDIDPLPLPLHLLHLLLQMMQSYVKRSPSAMLKRF